jgi:thiol-disulfide isomerase/thioredoxin
MATTVLSFQNLDCSDCGEEVARALIEDSKVFKTKFDKNKAELTVVADPSVDALSLAVSKREGKDAWQLVPGAGKGHYVALHQSTELDIADVDPAVAAKVESLGALAVKGKVTIVDLSAKWCGPCHELDAHVVEWMGTHAGVAYRRIDVGDWESPVGERFLGEVKELPYVVLFDRNGAQSMTMSGLDVPRLDGALETLLK